MLSRRCNCISLSRPPIHHMGGGHLMPCGDTSNGRAVATLEILLIFRSFVILPDVLAIFANDSGCRLRIRRRISVSSAHPDPHDRCGWPLLTTIAGDAFSVFW